MVGLSLMGWALAGFEEFYEGRKKSFLFLFIFALFWYLLTRSL